MKTEAEWTHFSWAAAEGCRSSGVFGDSAAQSVEPILSFNERTAQYTNKFNTISLQSWFDQLLTSNMQKKNVTVTDDEKSCTFKQWPTLQTKWWRCLFLQSSVHFGRSLWWVYWPGWVISLISHQKSDRQNKRESKKQRTWMRNKLFVVSTISPCPEKQEIQPSWFTVTTCFSLCICCKFMFNPWDPTVRVQRG